MSKSEAFKNVVTGLAALAVPIAVAVVGHIYAAAAKDKDVGIRFVELAINILSKEPTSADANVRRWAIRVLDKYSDVQISQEARQDIIERVPLPVSPPKIVDTPLPEGSRATTGTRFISRIIVRDTQQDDIDQELQGLRRSRVAYHYLIAKDGTTHSLADENDVAFHTAGHNADSIGIGLLHVSGSEYTPEQVEALSALLSDIVARRRIAKASILAATDVDPRRRSDFPRIKDKVVARLP